MVGAVRIWRYRFAFGSAGGPWSRHPAPMLAIYFATRILIPCQVSISTTKIATEVLENLSTLLNHHLLTAGSTIHDTFTKNSARLAEVWMDEYKEYFYNVRPHGVSSFFCRGEKKRLKRGKKVGGRKSQSYRHTHPDLQLGQCL